jgi:hypothetical protein
MDEEKKSEAGGAPPERLGPYLLQEQVQQSHDSPVELYLATHETNGATALVRKHTAGELAAPRKNWRVRLGCWASQGYSALEMEHTDWARAQDRQSAESLLFTLEGVLEEARSMARAFDDTHAPRLPWRVGLAVASAATLGALLFALVRLVPVFPSPSAPPAPLSHEVPTAGGPPDQPTRWGLVDTADAGQSVLARPLPKEPFKGQKRPPCHRYAEVEIIGACWTPHKLKAPCPDILYEYQGECYLPSLSAKPPPSSLGQ